MRKRKEAGLTLIEVLVVVVILAVVLLVVFNFGPSDESARRAIEAQGFKNVSHVERHWLGSHYLHGCGDDDAFAFTAQAINANDQQVKVVACTGYFFKGYTIRTGR